MAASSTDAGRHVLLIRVWGGEFAAMTAADEYGIDRLRNRVLYGTPDPEDQNGGNGGDAQSEASGDEGADTSEEFEWDYELFSFPDGAALGTALALMEAALDHVQTYDRSKSCENHTHVLNEAEYLAYRGRH